MTSNRRVLGLISLLVGLAYGATAAAEEYRLTQPGVGRPTGGRLQIGTGLPLPVGADGIFTGGQMSTTGLITTRMGGANMVSTGPAIWPPLLLIGPTANALAGTKNKLITQNLATNQGGAVKVPATVLKHVANGNPRHGGVFNTNPAVYDVATTLAYQWPQAVANFAPGGGPAPAFPGVAPFGGPGGGTITYGRRSAAATEKSFGGPAFFAIQAGPNAGTRIVPPNGAGMVPIATVFINAAQGTPQMVGFAGLVAASNPLGMAAQGAPLASIPATTMFGPVPGAVHAVNMTALGMCTMWCVGANGTIKGLPMDPTTITAWSVGPAIGAFTHNNATTEGFPWSTGAITVKAPGALGSEIFYLSGADGRKKKATAPGMTGEGNLSLVSGALSQRNVSKANANRAFVSLNLPEPSVGLGAAGALGALALCHALVRRRSL